MMRWMGPFLVAGLSAVVGYTAVIEMTPRVIMSVAIDRLSARMGVNQLFHTPRITEASRDVVRSSPDLAYSICAFDLSDGPLTIAFDPGETYASLSLFDAATNNFFRVNDQDLGGATLSAQLVDASAASFTLPHDAIVSPSQKGVLLIRRLAPTLERFEQARLTGANDRCSAPSAQ